jgi:hypothetical protein
MKGSPVDDSPAVGNASLLNATVDAIDTNWGCIAARCVINARSVGRG